MTLTPIALALMMGPVQEVAAPADALHEADVRIVLHETYAVVVSAYVIDRGGDSLVFEAPRVPGQVVLVNAAFGPETELEPVHEVERRLLVARTGAAGRAVFRLRYNVEGELSRIPLFVPRVASAPDIAVTITLVGVDERDLDKLRLPFETQADGTLRATAPQLPETVQLSSPDAPLRLPRLFLWLVLFAFVTVSLYLLGRALLARRARA